MDERSERADLRHELKFVSDESALPALRMVLRGDRAGIRTLHPPRLVQSLYLDTSFQKALADNLAGLSVREKFRLRWYGAAKRGVLGVLERKRRENSLGWKHSLRLAEPLDVEGAERRRFVVELTRRAGPEWRAVLGGLEPAQWVRYEREYLTSADRRVRLTLDRKLFFADQRPLGRLSDRERTPSQRLLVLEVKCAPEDLDRAQEIVARLPIPLGRCSKFVLAAEPGSGPLPSLLEL